jgi:hypothetical protein
LLLELLIRLLLSCEIDEAEDLFVPFVSPELAVVFIIMIVDIKLSLFSEVLLLFTYSRSASETGFEKKKKT